MNQTQNMQNKPSLIRISILAFLLLSYVKNYSQNIDKILNSDTLYVYFKKDNINQTKSSNNIINEENHNYYFYFSIDETKVRQQCWLINHYSLTPEVKWKSKSFLKEKKDLIVNYKFLKALGYKESHMLFAKKKKIYIIDADYNRHSKIKLIEASYVDNKGLMSIE